MVPRFCRGRYPFLETLRTANCRRRVRGYSRRSLRRRWYTRPSTSRPCESDQGANPVGLSRAEVAADLPNRRQIQDEAGEFRIAVDARRLVEQVRRPAGTVNLDAPRARVDQPT